MPPPLDSPGESPRSTPPPDPPALSPEAAAAVARVEALRKASAARRSADVRARARRADRVLLCALAVVGAAVTASIIAEI